MSGGDVEQFYNALASEYDLMFEDWRASITRQGTALDAVIRAQMGGEARTLLDCSCGIGTQAIGLAEQGYKVHASDLSPEAVDRARREADQLSLLIRFDVADMRVLEMTIRGTFDVVISCDNSWAHLLTDEDMYAAAESMAGNVRPDGLLLLSIRDYDALIVGKPRATEPRIYADADGKRIFFQIWDWAENGRVYTLHHYITQGKRDAWKVSHFVTTLRAVLRNEVDRALEAAGLSDIRWHNAAEMGYHQPIVTGWKRP